MGQYYHPAILAEDKKTVNKWLHAHKYGDGLKLMEHSWIGNKFVRAFESLIYHNPQRVVWAGDYAENCEGLKTNVYNRCTEKKDVSYETPATEIKARYIVNHSKKEFINKLKVPKMEGWAINPLPLMTCEGNGQGGGDFYGSDFQNFVGSWARDVISIENRMPKGFKEIIFDLIEK